MEKILISRRSLAERWDFTSTKVIEKYEHEGILTRNPNIKVPRYYMEEILKIEALEEVNPLSPLERKQLEKRIEELEKELNIYKEKINNIKVLLF
ncbi:transcription factor [Clostridium botulinum]|uniref:transcription factor n=1 Tax=Clostridium botulinum TaxID=1491 RepID=UPI0013F038B3|nr:transcription factor [Clostridium botulinum]MBN1079282.1 transcription factor [Clostridium botulinum]NFH89713.1 transcription factor [Clostridium botulinum]NFI17134.1 transcription factor [Clostridium botulinum]NFI51683.1 transcription factor [Clostridium botulinum]NFL92813.1 transcription factor [Clostridium botulinum]